LNRDILQVSRDKDESEEKAEATSIAITELKKELDVVTKEENELKSSRIEVSPANAAVGICSNTSRLPCPDFFYTAPTYLLYWILCIHRFIYAILSFRFPI
jgi:hypothetical protein